jgi:hypothetical protein
VAGVTKSLGKSAGDGKSELFPKSDSALVRAYDKIELHTISFESKSEDGGSCANRDFARYWFAQTIARTSSLGRNVMKAVCFLILAVSSCLFSSVSMAQKLNAPVTVPRINIAPRPAPLQQSNIGVAGYPTGPTLLPYPMVSTPSNDAFARQNAWAAYNAQLHQIPTAPNPNRLAPQQNLLDPNRFVQAPQSSDRYNFQFTDNEVRSVQKALRIRGIYSGQVDGILGPDTRRAIKSYQSRNKLPVTGQPDTSLNASLGIF